LANSKLRNFGERIKKEVQKIPKKTKWLAILVSCSRAKQLEQIANSFIKLSGVYNHFS